MTSEEILNVLAEFEEERNELLTAIDDELALQLLEPAPDKSDLTRLIRRLREVEIEAEAMQAMLLATVDPEDDENNYIDHNMYGMTGNG